jgi:endo-1,4-beta-xylanase
LFIPPLLFISQHFAFGVLATLLAALSTALAYPTESLVESAGTSSETGTSGGYYYPFYTDGGDDGVYTNQARGEYSVT